MAYRQRQTDMFYVLPKTLLKGLLLLHQISAYIHTGNKFLNQILLSIFVLPIHLWDLAGQMFLCIEPVSKCCIIYQQAPWTWAEHCGEYWWCLYWWCTNWEKYSLCNVNMRCSLVWVRVNKEGLPKVTSKSCTTSDRARFASLRPPHFLLKCILLPPFKGFSGHL